MTHLPLLNPMQKADHRNIGKSDIFAEKMMENGCATDIIS
jgi:hypothetical protein